MAEEKVDYRYPEAEVWFIGPKWRFRLPPENATGKEAEVITVDPRDIISIDTSLSMSGGGSFNILLNNAGQKYAIEDNPQKYLENFAKSLKRGKKRKKGEEGHYMFEGEVEKHPWVNSDSTPKANYTSFLEHENRKLFAEIDGATKEVLIAEKDDPNYIPYQKEEGLYWVREDNGELVAKVDVFKGIPDLVKFTASNGKEVTTSSSLEVGKDFLVKEALAGATRVVVHGPCLIGYGDESPLPYPEFIIGLGEKCIWIMPVPDNISDVQLHDVEEVLYLGEVQRINQMSSTFLMYTMYSDPGVAGKNATYYLKEGEAVFDETFVKDLDKIFVFKPNEARSIVTDFLTSLKVSKEYAYDGIVPSGKDKLFEITFDWAPLTITDETDVTLVEGKNIPVKAVTEEEISKEVVPGNIVNRNEWYYIKAGDGKTISKADVCTVSKSQFFNNYRGEDRRVKNKVLFDHFGGDQTKGRCLFRPMDKVVIKFKGTSTETEGELVTAFTGIVSTVTQSYTENKYILKISGEDVSKWLKVNQANVDPSLFWDTSRLDSIRSDYGFRLYNHAFAGLQGWKIIKLMIIGGKWKDTKDNVEHEYHGINSFDTFETIKTSDHPTGVYLKDFIEPKEHQAQFLPHKLHLVVPFGDGKYIPYKRYFRSGFNYFAQDFKNVWDLCKQVADDTFFVFFADEYGDIWYRPPYFDLKHLLCQKYPQTHVIDERSIRSCNITTSDKSIVTHLEVSSENPYDFMHYSYQGKPFGYWSSFDSLPLTRTFGRRVKTVTTNVVFDSPDGTSNTAKALFMFAKSLMYRINKDIVTAQVDLVGRPEVRLGYPVYIPSKNLVFNVDSVSHRFEYGGSYTTSVGLNYGRKPWEYMPELLDMDSNLVSHYITVGEFGGTEGISELLDKCKSPPKREMFSVVADRVFNCTNPTDKSHRRAFDVLPFVGKGGYGRNVFVNADLTDNEKTVIVSVADKKASTGFSFYLPAWITDSELMNFYESLGDLEVGLTAFVLELKLGVTDKCGSGKGKSFAAVLSVSGCTVNELIVRDVTKWGVTTTLRTPERLLDDAHIRADAIFGNKYFNGKTLKEIRGSRTSKGFPKGLELIVFPAGAEVSYSLRPGKLVDYIDRNFLQMPNLFVY